jgi:hypothetical protein
MEEYNAQTKHFDFLCNHGIDCGRASVAGASTMTVEQVREMLLWSAIINYGGT